MKLAFVLFLVFLTTTSSFPDIRIDHLVFGWVALGRVSYSTCDSTDFVLYSGEIFIGWRGWCFPTEISANMIYGNKSIRALSYTSGVGTSYSQFEIV